MAFQHEKDIENKLAEKITDFLLEMGRGFSYIGRQYNVKVDGDDYYIDILMYHVKLHCYVVIELKAVEFIPEFVSKLNFYISAVDEYVKSSEDNPTIGLLLCRNKSNKKVEFALRGLTQPMGVAQYETDQLFNEVASALPNIQDLEDSISRLSNGACPFWRYIFRHGAFFHSLVFITHANTVGKVLCCLCLDLLQIAVLPRAISRLAAFDRRGHVCCAGSDFTR